MHPIYNNLKTNFEFVPDFRSYVNTGTELVENVYGKNNKINVSEYI